MARNHTRRAEDRLRMAGAPAGDVVAQHPPRDGL
jgi:hypothetical protein